MLIAYLNEHEDARTTQRLVEDAGCKAILVPGDIQSAKHCREIVDQAGANSAASTFWSTTQRIRGMGADLPGKHPCDVLPDRAYETGSAIINTGSINADTPNPTLLAYATTKGAIQNFTAGLAHCSVRKECAPNAVAPGPIWTPLIPSTMPEEAAANFGKSVPMKRAGQIRRTCYHLFGGPALELCVRRPWQ